MRFNHGRLLLFSLATILAGGCEQSSRLEVAGKVSVDGTPVDQGMITFQPASGNSKPSGAKVEDGKFALPAARGLNAGEYTVSLIAMRRTGEKIRDPQTPNPIDKMEIIHLKTKSQPATIAIDNATRLELDFAESR